jgi:hypothetical protein
VCRGGQSGKDTFNAISEFVDPQFIPVEYGGQLKCGKFRIHLLLNGFTSWRQTAGSHGFN